MSVQRISFSNTNNCFNDLYWRQHESLSDNEIKQNFYIFAKQIESASDKDCKRAVPEFITHILSVLEKDPDWQKKLLDDLASDDPSCYWLNPHLFECIQKIGENINLAFQLLQLYSRWGHINKILSYKILRHVLQLHKPIVGKLWDVLVISSIEVMSWSPEERTTLLSQLLIEHPEKISEALSHIPQWNVPSPDPILIELAKNNDAIISILFNTCPIWECLVSEETRLSIAKHMALHSYHFAYQFLHTMWHYQWMTTEFRSHILECMVDAFPVRMAITLRSLGFFDTWISSITQEARLSILCKICHHYSTAKKILGIIFYKENSLLTAQQKGKIIEIIMENHGIDLCGTLFDELEMHLDKLNIITLDQWKKIISHLISGIERVPNNLQKIIEFLVNGYISHEIVPFVLEKFVDNHIHHANHQMHYLFNTLLSHIPEWHTLCINNPNIQEELKTFFLKYAQYATDINILHTWLIEESSINNSDGRENRRIFSYELQHNKQWVLPFLENWHRSGLISDTVYMQITVATHNVPLSDTCKTILLAQAEYVKRYPRFQILVLSHAHELTQEELLKLGIDRMHCEEMFAKDLVNPFYFQSIIKLLKRKELHHWPIIQAASNKIVEYLPKRKVFYNLVTSPFSLVSDTDIQDWIIKIRGIKDWFFYMALICHYRPLIISTQMLSREYLEHTTRWNFEKLHQTIQQELPQVPRCKSYTQSIQKFLKELQRLNISEDLSAVADPRGQLKLLSQYLDDPTQTINGLTWYPNNEQIEDMKKIIDHCISLLHEKNKDILCIIASYLETVFLNCSSGKKEAISAIYNILNYHYHPQATNLNGLLGNLIAHAREEFFQQFSDKEANDLFPLINHQNTHWIGRARAILAPYIGGTFSNFDSVNIPISLRAAVITTFTRGFSLPHIINYIHKYVCQNDEHIEQFITLVETNIREHCNNQEEAQCEIFQILYGMNREQVDRYYTMELSETGESSHPSLHQLFKEKVNIEKILIMSGFVKTHSNT